VENGHEQIGLRLRGEGAMRTGERECAEFSTSFFPATASTISVNHVETSMSTRSSEKLVLYAKSFCMLFYFSIQSILF
jgi:hypothetical protein